MLLDSSSSFSLTFQSVIPSGGLSAVSFHLAESLWSHDKLMDRYSLCEAEVTAQHITFTHCTWNFIHVLSSCMTSSCLTQPGHGVSSPCCCKPCFISHNYSINNTHHVVCCGGLCAFAQAHVVFSCTKVFTQLRLTLRCFKSQLLLPGTSSVIVRLFLVTGHLWTLELWSCFLFSYLTPHVHILWTSHFWDSLRSISL